MKPTNTAKVLMRSKVSAALTALFLIAASSFLYSFLFVAHFVPIEGTSWDSLLYLAPGQRMYQGEMIYRDVFEFVTPGTALVNFLMFKLFGLRLWIPDLLSLLLGLGVVWLGILISKRLMRPGLALLPSALFLVLARGQLCDSTHHWYSVLTAIAAMAILLETRTAARIAAAGFFCALSASFTQTRGLAVVLGFALFLWWESRRRQEGWRTLLKKEGWLLTSFLVTFLAVNAYFIWQAGPEQYFWCTVVYVLRYYPKLASANTFQVIGTQFPVFETLRTFINPFAQWLLLFAFIPLVFIMFFVRYWRNSCKKPLEYWERPMLIAIVSSFMLLSIAPAPDYVRMRASMMPAMILLGWFLDSPRKIVKGIVFALSTGTLLMAIYSVAARRPSPVGILTTPQGQLAYTEPGAYLEDTWILHHTHPLDYFFEPAYSDVYFYLDLRNPTPFSCIENNGYTTIEQVADVIQGLEQHKVRYILWASDYLDVLPKWEKPSEDHLGPLREYIHSHYTRVKVFPDSKEIWEKKTETELPVTMRNKDKIGNPVPMLSKGFRSTSLTILS